MSYLITPKKGILLCAKRFRQCAFVFLFAFMFSAYSFGNNLQLSNIAASTTGLTFDINWENSWNLSTAPSNWDGVWVFVKVQDCNTTEKTWNHQLFSITSADHSVTGGVLQ